VLHKVEAKSWVLLQMTINKQDGQAISVNKEKALKSTRKESNQITHRPADGK